MNKKELELLLNNHQIWFDSKIKEGEKADLSGTDLSGTDLRGANLRGANLRGANIDGEVK